MEKNVLEYKSKIDEHLGKARIITEPKRTIPYSPLKDPPAILPEWKNDYKNRVDTGGILFTKEESLQTQHLNRCVPIIVQADSETCLLHVAGGSIHDETIPTLTGREPIVHQQRTKLIDFFNEHPSARAIMIESPFGDYLQTVDSLLNIGIAIDTLIRPDFENIDSLASVAYRPKENEVLAHYRGRPEVMVFDGFSKS